MARVLVVEDEVILSRELAQFLEQAGHSVRAAAGVREAISLSEEESPDLALVDLRLPDGCGLEVLSALREQDPSLIVVIMTAYGSIREAVDAVQSGATDYLQKPLDLDELVLLIERLLARQRQDRELSYLRERGRVRPEGIVGEDPRLLAIFEQAKRLAEAELRPGERPSILLTGETGTGKGMVARAIHEILGGGPFVEANCTAMPSELVEAELFGHERGAFTDARASRPGLFEAAERGAIFLDEIGDLEARTQAKFLKVVEEKRVRRLGSTRDRAIDVQVIAATHRDLDEAVRSNEFRADLLHRLRVLSFEIPPLRERRSDVVLLARHFCEQLARQYGRAELRLTNEAEVLLCDYAWPGNVRELRNVLERAALLQRNGVLGREDIAALIASGAHDAKHLYALPEGGIELESLERDLLKQALDRTGGNRTRAAALLGLTRDTLRYRIEKYDLT